MSDPAGSHLDRRSFLIGGAVIGASLYVGIRLAQNRFDKGHAGAGQVFKPNAFLRISPDWQIGAQGAILIIVLALRALTSRRRR